MTSPRTLIIFDFDNTLIDSRIDFSGLRAALLDLWSGRAPLPAPREALARLPIPEIVSRAAEVAPDLAGALWSTIEAYEAAGLDTATPTPHAHSVLATLAARPTRLALLTNNARAATTRLLETETLAAFFELVVTRDDVPALKPSPAGVHVILDRIRPVDIAYLVGDAWIDGIAAQQAGVRFIGFGPREAESRARGVHAWRWISDLRELLALDLTA